MRRFPPSAQIDNHDITLFRFDIDAIEIAVQIAPGDKLQVSATNSPLLSALTGSQ